MAECKRLQGKKCAMPEVFYLYMDRGLSPAKVKKLKAYLAKNRNCCRHFEFEKELRSSLRKRCSAGRAPKSLKSKIKKKLSGS